MRNKRLEIIKQDLYNQWIIFKRMPLLVVYISGVLGAIVLIILIVSSIIKLLLGL